MQSSDFSVVDLFCGVGGLTHGLITEGFTVSAGVDFDKTCKYAYEKNNRTLFLHKDITQMDSKELNALYPINKRKILVGCAPCQPFSVFNHKNYTGQDDKLDSKWKLLYSFADLIEETQPEIISMENVPQLKLFKKGQVLKDFIERLEKNHYYVSYGVYNAKDYGVPQRRKRLILLASKYGNINLIPPTHSEKEVITVEKAIGHLPQITDGVHCPNDFLHFARKLSDLSLKRIKATKEGGSWRDWDESLKLECHKKEKGKAFGSVYGRMVRNDISPTITTYCIGLNNGRFGHPTQDRAISLREAAILQSFPENYEFIDPSMKFSATVIARQIGNAVPVGLGIAIAKSIQIHINSLND